MKRSLLVLAYYLHAEGRYCGTHSPTRAQLYSSELPSIGLGRLHEPAGNRLETLSSLLLALCPTSGARAKVARFSTPRADSEPSLDVESDLVDSSKVTGKRVGGRSQEVEGPRPSEKSSSITPFQAGLSRIAGGGLFGVVGGSVAHAAINQFTDLGASKFSSVDSLLNLFDLVLGSQLGVALGSLWAVEAAFVNSGIIRATTRQAIKTIVNDEFDKKAGAGALRTVRENLANDGSNWPLRLAFFLSGLYWDPAVERLMNDAESQRGSAEERPMSDVIASVFEATLAGRLGDIRLLVVVIAFFIGASVNVGALFFGTTFSLFFGGGR